jgi:glycosyltransferase involved in cell wall biosynthesis
MNILLLTHSYPEKYQKWRGVFIQEQVKALSSEHSIIVVYFKVNYSHFAPFAKYSFTKSLSGNVTEYEVTISRSLPVITQLKYLLNTYDFINTEILKQKKIDIIHSHLSYPAGLLGTIIQKRKNIPNVLTEHTWIKKYFRSRIHKLCVLYALRNSRAIVSVSKALKDDIVSYCDREITVIPNVIDVDKFKISKFKKSKSLNIGLLGGLGNFRKGLDILIKSIPLLKDMDIMLHIGGSGILLEQYKQLARELDVYEKCSFYGELAPSEIIDFYSYLDIYVLASRDETFGVVVVEAMAIATKCGGPEEIITEETGLLIDKENPDELAKAIVYISENIENYNQEQIIQYARDHYGQEAFVHRINKLYQDLLK